VVEAAVQLGRALREAGLPVTPERSATFARALAVTPPERDAVYWAARACLTSGHDQAATFDAVFAQVVDGIADPADSRGDPTAPALPGPQRQTPAPPAVSREAAPGGQPGGEPSGGTGDDAADDERDVPVGVAASEAERLSEVRLDELDERELAVVAHLLRRMIVATPPRKGRRSHPRRRGDHLDVRATLRKARTTGGDPVHRLHRRRTTRPRPLVALLDVSGSMAPYARAYLLLLEGAARGARAETFVFATRLTRVTRALRDGRAERAVERAGAAAPDWSSGTRICDALRAYNDRHGRRGMARGAVVVILSDGWERGDPALVGREMERLHRLAHRVIWVNPRVSAPGFEPKAGGLRAALPHIDELVSGHSVAALDDVIAAIGVP
jgi:uncharacterized protein with von Willebrand factor type A (vWA) domain